MKKVRLVGKEQTLERLATVCGSSELSVNRDDTDNEYYLESSEFESCDSAGEVLEIADTLLDGVYAFGKIESAVTERPETAGVIETNPDGTRHISVSANETVAMTDEVRVEVVTEDGTTEMHRTGDWTAKLAPLVTEDEAVAELASLLAREDDWVNLYRIYEFVENHAGEQDLNIVDEGWISSEEKDLFKHTANSRDALGDEARHARGSTPAPDSPMTHSTAKSIIHSLARSWLEYRQTSIES